MRELIERLIAAGQWKDTGPEILIVVDTGYEVPRLAFLLKDLPVRVLGPDAVGPGPAPRGPAPRARHPGTATPSRW